MSTRRRKGQNLGRRGAKGPGTGLTVRSVGVALGLSALKLGLQKAGRGRRTSR